MEYTPSITELFILAGAFLSYSVFVWLFLRIIIKWQERRAKSEREVEADSCSKQEKTKPHYSRTTE